MEFDVSTYVLGIVSGVAAFIIGAYLWDQRQKRKRGESLKRVLLHELWVNLNFVSQIEESYENNLADPENVHMPHYPPRTSVIGRCLDPGTLFSLPDTERPIMLEIFAQLEGCKAAFEEWKRDLYAAYRVQSPDSTASLDTSFYERISSTLLSYVSPTMRNMFDLSVALANEFGTNDPTPQIQEFGQLLKAHIRKGKWIRSAYKASDYKGSDELGEPRFDILLCWINDWPDCPKEVIEAQPLLRLHESWVSKRVKGYGELPCTTGNSTTMP